MSRYLSVRPHWSGLSLAAADDEDGDQQDEDQAPEGS